jgi:uncharacterized protein
MASGERFWNTKTLEEMSVVEWELLCDRCAKCCLHKIEDVQSGRVFFTNVACRLLEPGVCHCHDYDHRMDLVQGCVTLTASMVREVNWLPESCAYRRLAEGRGLAWWHPLVSGDASTVHQAGVSIVGKIIKEACIDLSNLEAWIVDWID